MVSPNGSHERYAELKESVRVLRAQVRGSRVPSRGNHVASTVVSTTDDASGAMVGQDDGIIIKETDPQESFTMQHLRLQFKIEMQKKNEEIKKLIAKHRGKSQQMENLESEHRVQKKKLEARIQHQSEKICALEAQLSYRITLHQQELQAQSYAFASKLRQCENEMGQQLVAVRGEHVATVAATEERHRAEISKAQVIYVLSLRKVEDAESKVKDLEAKATGLKKSLSESQELSIKKDDESNAKMDKIIAVYEDQIQDLKIRLKKEKDELEQVKEGLTKKHALELQSYKMQKAREIDQVSERVRAAVESREATIAHLKEELSKQQEQASCLLDFA